MMIVQGSSKVRQLKLGGMYSPFDTTYKYNEVDSSGFQSLTDMNLHTLATFKDLG